MDNLVCINTMYIHPKLFEVENWLCFKEKSPFTGEAFHTTFLPLNVLPYNCVYAFNLLISIKVWV